MEPLSVLGVIGVTLQLVKLVWHGLLWMGRIYETSVQGDKVLRSMALEFGIYGNSIKAIGQWLKKNQAATGLGRQMRTTHKAITLVKCSMANI